MSTLTTLTRMTGLALVLGACAVLAATPGAAAKRQKVYVNKGAPTYGDLAYSLNLIGRRPSASASSLARRAVLIVCVRAI